MRSQTISSGSKNRGLNLRGGFTLIEMILVVSLVTIIGGLGLYFGFDSLRGYTFHSDRDVLVAALQHARAEAISNICRGDDCEDGRPHGVKITDDKFTIFQGKSFDSRDADFDASLDASKSTKHTGMDEVVFTQLSGAVADPGDIIITDSTGRNSTISINSEGQILWTN